MNKRLFLAAAVFLAIGCEPIEWEFTCYGKDGTVLFKKNGTSARPPRLTGDPVIYFPDSSSAACENGEVKVRP